MGAHKVCIFLACFSLFSAAYAAVTLKIDGLKATLKNDNVELNFNADATISTLLVKGKDIAKHGEKTFYLDWNNNGQGVFSPSSIHVVEQQSKRVHFYWVQDQVQNAFNIELHYIMVDGLDGVYCYAKYTNDKSAAVTLGETRMVFRFNPTILPQGTNHERSGTIPTSAELDKSESVQDSTWKLTDGTYYSKYDYAAYIRKSSYQGLYGNGYGAFVISASKDYHGGGALKQDLTVHHESLICNYFMSSHFGTPGINAPPGWVHIYGPFLLYFPTAGSDSEVLSAVQAQVETEKAQWPYAFVNDDEYPRIRGSISGYITGQKKATVVAYNSVDEEHDKQEHGYVYTANTDDTGYYMLDKVRPGTYKVVAYPLAGHGSENQAEGTVTVTAGNKAHIGFDLPEPQNIMWSIGEANRRANEFKYADQPRNYQWEWLPPAENTFVIGQSNQANDWYYSQAQAGNWYIKYQDTADGSSRTLRIALAAASNKPHLLVYVNGHKIGDTYFDNDQSIYRSAMQSGSYYSNVLTINSAQIVNGENTIQLFMSRGQIMYDVISLQKN